jgi:hypothetical protein
MTTKPDTKLLAYIPEELRTPLRWLQYYLKPDPKKPSKKPTKHPCVKYAAPEHKANLRSLDHLLGRAPQAGFQRLVDKQEGFVFVDIDHCRDATSGVITEAARAIVDSLDTYCEVSVSGNGLHLVCRGVLPDDFHVEGNPVEIYSGNIPNKLMAMTGDIFELHHSIETRQEEATALLANLQKEVGHASAAKPAEQFSEDIIFKSMADVEEKPVKWMWLNKIPLAAVTVFTGNPDTGKTMAYCDLAARVSSFAAFPDVEKDDRGRPRHTFGGHVLLLAAEDDYARVIKPRLMAAGASLGNIAYIDKVEIREGARRDERMFALDADLKKLEAAIGDGRDKRSVSLIIIDPISSYFGKGSMYKAQDIRNVFNRLTAMCEKHTVSVVAVEHFSKRTDVAAIHKLGGSVAITAAARAAFMFAKVPDEDSQYVMHFIKGNFSKRKVGLRYTIEDKKISTLPDPVPFIKWGVEDAGTADDLLGSERGFGEGRKRDKCVEWLKEILADGERRSSEVYEQGETVGYSGDTIKRALREGGFPKAKQKRDGWYMQPHKGTQNSSP